MRLENYLHKNIPKSSIKWVDEIEQHDDICEDSLLLRTNWSIQKQMYVWLNLCELFDKNMPVNKESGGYFILSFIVDDMKYYFQAIPIDKNKGIWSVLFYPRGGVVFGNLKGDSEFNTIISGLFISVKMLIDEKNAKYIHFGTDDKDLQRVYDKMVPYIEKRLPLKFVKSESKGQDKLYYFKVVGE